MSFPASGIRGSWSFSFTEHPASVGETYAEHARTAFGFGTSMLWAGVAVMVHGILPFVFTTTGSRTIARLYDRMVVARCRTR